MNLFGLTPKEFIELRLKCLETYVSISSKHGIEKDEVLIHAEKAWNSFVVWPLVELANEIPQNTGPQMIKPEGKVSKAKK